MSIAVQTSETHHASPQALRDAWHALSSQKSLRIRDAAHTLGVSEAQLLATGIGNHVIRLAGDLRDLMMCIPVSCRSSPVWRRHSCLLRAL